MPWEENHQNGQSGIYMSFTSDLASKKERNILICVEYNMINQGNWAKHGGTCV